MKNLLEPEEPVSRLMTRVDGLGHKLQTRYRLLTESSVSNIMSIVQMAGGGTLVLPAKSSVLRDETLVRLLDKVDLPVLLVR